MNRFIIVDGLPYLYADGKAFAVRWDEKGFTVGAEVELTEAPDVTYSEISILAKCHECLNSIDPDAEGQKEETDNKQAENQEEDPDAEGQKEQAEGEKEENTEAPALEEMTVANLKAYAAAKGIDLGTATKKADIIAAINAAE